MIEMTIKELMHELSTFSEDTRIDFVLLDEDWEDSTKDIELKVKGVVGSGDTGLTQYLELGLTK